MTQSDDQIGEFVSYLTSLAREGHEDRGALADLRSGLAAGPGMAPRMFRHVVKHLGDHERRSDRWFYVVGTMFGANPLQVKGNTMGKCFELLSKRGSDSIEARFVALLGAHPDDLPSHLYHGARLLKSKDIGIDYYRLLRDLIHWDSADRYVQNQWARDYYRKSDNDKEEDNVE